MKDLARTDSETFVNLMQKCALHLTGVAAALVIFLLAQYRTEPIFFIISLVLAIVALSFSLMLYIMLMLKTPQAIAYLKKEQGKNGHYSFLAITVSAGCSLLSFIFLLGVYSGWFSLILLIAIFLSFCYCARYIINR